MCAIFKVFIEFVTILLLFYVFLVFWPWAMWDLSSPTKGRTCTPALEGEVLTTGPPEKSLCSLVLIWNSDYFKKPYMTWTFVKLTVNSIFGKEFVKLIKNTKNSLCLSSQCHL